MSFGGGKENNDTSSFTS
jgi:hypothetical protein